MKNLSLSVIIPTYNRKDILKRCLTALFNQTYPCSNYEIIVVDDGSNDGTEKLVKSMINNSPCTLQYFRREHKGPAAARNVGIKNANGKIILFIGDDIIATPTLLEEHFKWHSQYPDDNVAVLGYVTWSPEIEITPFMKWLENGGPQFAFWQIGNKVEIDGEKCFYTANISLKKTFLLENGIFDEEFPYAAHEDTELGHRLKTKGMNSKYNKDAVAYHYHFTSLEDACQRMIRVGESCPILMKKIGHEQEYFAKPAFRRFLSKIKFFPYYYIAKFYEKRAIKAKIFRYVLDCYGFIGMKKSRDRKV